MTVVRKTKSMNTVQISRVPSNPYVMVTVEIHSEEFLKLLQGTNKKAEAAVGKDFLNAIHNHIKENHSQTVNEKINDSTVSQES